MRALGRALGDPFRQQVGQLGDASSAGTPVSSRAKALSGPGSSSSRTTRSVSSLAATPSSGRVTPGARRSRTQPAGASARE
ncbi:hypothetical protein [Nocardia asteroides]|uniref:hypothetical protein n=1 Tax=Nocardia asteroides TaxID=1824 RepID=UPI0018D54501|nr:hypothetical protein [Nocardia asteroides]UGT48437.1 hypothetical protein LT345_28920 [Nocardia asteroides]